MLINPYLLSKCGRRNKQMPVLPNPYRFWTDQDRLDEEQEWQDCEQEVVGSWQEGLRQHQGLDCCCPEGQEGFGRQGLRRSEEGNASLQEGQGALPVSSTRKHTKASAQGVGMSTPLERSCFDLNDV